MQSSLQSTLIVAYCFLLEYRALLRTSKSKRLPLKAILNDPSLIPSWMVCSIGAGTGGSVSIAASALVSGDGRYVLASLTDGLCGCCIEYRSFPSHSYVDYEIAASFQYLLMIFRSCFPAPWVGTTAINTITGSNNDTGYG